MFYGSRQDNQSSMQQRPLFLWFLWDISKIKYSVDGKTVSCWLILVGLLNYNPLSKKYLNMAWWQLQRQSFAIPLSPNIHIQILQTDLYTFP